MANAEALQCEALRADLLSVEVAVSTEVPSERAAGRIAWVTSFLFFAALAIFAAIAVATDRGLADRAVAWVYRPA